MASLRLSSMCSLCFWTYQPLKGTLSSLDRSLWAWSVACGHHTVHIRHVLRLIWNVFKNSNTRPLYHDTVPLITFSNLLWHKAWVWLIGVATCGLLQAKRRQFFTISTVWSHLSIIFWCLDLQIYMNTKPDNKEQNLMLSTLCNFWASFLWYL